MPISISYALFPLANHRVLSTATLLPTPSSWLSLLGAGKNPSESQSSVQPEIQSLEQWGSRNRVQTKRVHCFSVFTWILYSIFCSFLPPKQQQLIRISHRRQEELELNQHHLVKPTQKACSIQMGFAQNRFHYIPNTICPCMLCQLHDRLQEVAQWRNTITTT